MHLLRYYLNLVLRLGFLCILGLFGIRGSNAQSDSIWEVLPHRLSSASLIIEGSDSLILSGSFTRLNDSAIVIAVLNDEDEIIHRYNTPVWVARTTFNWNGKRFFGGMGLWVESADSFKNIFQEKMSVFDALFLGDSIILCGLFLNSNDSLVANIMVCDSAFNCHYLPFYNKEVAEGGLFRLCYYDSALVVGGNFNQGNGIKEIAQFKNGVWSSLGDGLQGYGDEWVDDMVVFNDTLYVAGRFYEAFGNEGSLIMRWDGQKWLQAGQGIAGVQVHDLFVFQNHLWAAGIIDSVDGKMVNNLIRWNGIKWDGVPTDIRSNRIVSMGSFRNRMYVSGDFRELGAGIPVTNHMRMKDSSSYLNHLVTSSNEMLIGTNKISLYPTLTRGEVYLDFETNLQYRVLGVYTIQGREFELEQAVLSEQQIVLDASSLEPGLYWIRILLGSENVSLKFIVYR